MLRHFIKSLQFSKQLTKHLFLTFIYPVVCVPLRALQHLCRDQRTFGSQLSFYHVNSGDLSWSSALAVNASIHCAISLTDKILLSAC